MKIEFNLDIIVKSLIGILALAFILKSTRSLLLPFVVALFLHIIFYPLVDRLKKTRIPNFLVNLIVILITFFLIFVVSTTIFSSLDRFIKVLPRYQPRLEELFIQFKILLSRYDFTISDLNFQGYVNLRTISGFVASSIGTFLNFFAGFLMMFVYFVFMLVGHGQFRAKVERVFGNDRSMRISRFFDQAIRQSNRYLLVKTGASLLTGFNAAVIVWIFGLDFPITWGFLTFLFNFVPNFGSPVVTVLTLLFSLLKFNSIWSPVAMGLLLILNQVVVANFIEPPWAGKILDLSPLLILFSLIFWGWLWGIMGMIISIPLMAILKIAMENFNLTRPFARLMTTRE